MTAAEIKQIVADLRNQGTDTRRVEAKAARKAAPKLYETLSAFANTTGGLILLGVDEERDFEITGVADAAKVANDASSQCAEMQPVLQLAIDIVDVDGAQVVVLDVDLLPGSMRPCFRRASGVEKGTYLRRHDGDVRATWQEIQLMISEQQQPQEDLRPFPSASAEDFDEDLVEGLLERLRGRRGFAKLTAEQALRRLNALVEVDGRLVPTAAGLFALGSYPQEFLGQRMCIEYVIRPSEEQAAAGMRMGRSRSFSGPVPHMVDDALAALDHDLTGPVYIAQGQKRTTLQYPRDAMREAIVNALVHRTLRDTGEASTIEIYPDRLVISNPGGLYGLREDELADLERRPRSVSRNAVLVKLLEDVPDGNGETVVEARATGIATMLSEMRAAGMAPPRFHDQIATFEVEFPKHSLLDPDTVTWLSGLPLGEEITDQQRLALAMARRGEHLDNATYRQVTGIGDSRLAGRHLAQLVERELLQMHGTRRWAHYGLGAAAASVGQGVSTPSLPHLGHEGVDGVEGLRPTPRRATVERREAVMRYITAHGPVRVPAILAAVGTSTATIERDIAALRDAGRIRFEGPPATGGYVAVENKP